MGTLAKKRRRSGHGAKAGTPPGLVAYVGPERSGPARLSALIYDGEGMVEREVAPAELATLARDKPAGRVGWLRVRGLHQVPVLEAVGAAFGLHTLVLEDLANTSHRPKLENYGPYLFILLKEMLPPPSPDQPPDTRHLGLVWLPEWVISFEEAGSDTLEPVAQRVRGGAGRIRHLGADYLLVGLMDLVVDRYFGLLDDLAGRAEALEDTVLGEPQPGTLAEIHTLKRQLATLRRTAWPLRELTGRLMREPDFDAGGVVLPFVRDLSDNVYQTLDQCETLRDQLGNLESTLLAMTSNRMSQVMQVLTFVATFFMPLTLIAGIYGMNFQYMPELSWPWGYPAALGVMLAVAGGMYLYFKKKHWM